MEGLNTTGRRKTAVARVYLRPGSGVITVNNRELQQYFPAEVHQVTAKQALTEANVLSQYDVLVTVGGGGIKGQAEAIRLGTARALVKANPEHRDLLKKEGFLTRDSRMVERKKYGRRKARRRFQFSKR